MGKVHPGATLTPHFRDFLPAWVAGQEWYAGTGTPTLRPVGYLRLEDPAGQVGIETHIVGDGTAVYQIPMTYRDAPLPGRSEADGLIAVAEHSALGTRWIYDATIDPAWISQTIRLILTGGTTDPSSKSAGAPASAVGRLLEPSAAADGTLAVEVVRVLGTNDPGMTGHRAVGVLEGTWHPHGPDTPPETGVFAVAYRTP